MNSYEISIDTNALIAIDGNKTKIIEDDKVFVVNKQVNKIVEESCKYFGCSYKGRVEGTKNIIGVSHKAPIVIEETNNLILFPTSSPRIDSCCWISLNKIEKYDRENNGVSVLFSNNKRVFFDISYGIMNNQVLRASRLQQVLCKRKEKM